MSKFVASSNSSVSSVSEAPQTNEKKNKENKDKKGGVHHTPDGSTSFLEPEKLGTGQDFKAALLGSAKWLSKHSDAINALNVFPVPDGDTGTNMSRTMEAAVAEIASLADNSPVETVSKKLSYGALMGARGNSGVILSQIIRGLADGLSGKDKFSAADLAHALTKAKEMAYKAVMKPVEGTILTVVRESAEAAEEAAKQQNAFEYVLARAVEAAHAAVERTPTMLATLREAGVVDAGGHGYFIILEGALRHLRGESLDESVAHEFEQAKPKFTPKAEIEGEHRLDEFGYCTNFMLYADKPINFEEVRDTLSNMGTSAVIVGDNKLVKVHLHTEDPGSVLSYVTKMGALGQIKLDNMQFQHEEAFGAKAQDEERQQVEQLVDEEIADDSNAPLLQAKVSVVAVAPGDGLAQVFQAFGVDQVVRGGQTMNPSTQELLKAVEQAPSHEVLVLPNNKNIIMVAQQLQGLSNKKVAVVPSVTVPQGISALQAFNYEADLDENRTAMADMLNSVATGEVTRAVRTATVNGLAVESGQWIGLLNDELSVAATSKEAVIWQLLEQMNAGERDLLTFYYGETVSEVEAETLKAQVENRYPKQSVELVNGGQPNYDYIISAE